MIHLELQLLFCVAAIIHPSCHSLQAHSLKQGIGSPVLRLRGGLEIEGWTPAPLYKCTEWLEATTFDDEPVVSAFRCGWNAKNISKEVLLWMAAEMGDGRAISNLIGAGVNINAANYCGQTALHKVVQSAHEDLWCMSLLIGMGADLLAKDSNGMTPLDYAKQAAHYGGPQAAVILMEQAISALIPTAGNELALVPTLNEVQIEELIGNQSAWMDIHQTSPLPLSPAQFARLRKEMQSQTQDSTADVTRDQTTVKKDSKVTKKKRKKYASAKERWQSLKKKRRERATVLRGDA